MCHDFKCPEDIGFCKQCSCIATASLTAPSFSHFPQSKASQNEKPTDLSSATLVLPTRQEYCVHYSVSCSPLRDPGSMEGDHVIEYEF